MGENNIDMVSIGHLKVYCLFQNVASVLSNFNVVVHKQ
jgi:hypothetical protein